MRRIPHLIFLSVLIVPAARAIGAPVLVERGDVEVSIELEAVHGAGALGTEANQRQLAFAGKRVLDVVEDRELGDQVVANPLRAPQLDPLAVREVAHVGGHRGDDRTGLVVLPARLSHVDAIA